MHIAGDIDNMAIAVCCDFQCLGFDHGCPFTGLIFTIL
jgi:hypothetical protein